MADVILFRPKGLVEPTPRPPLALLFLAAPLIKNNYTVKIIDEEADFYWLEELDKELNDSTICVGITSMTGAQILGGLRLSKIVKDRFGVSVVWGGVHASMLPEQTVKNELVDIVVRGEGEEAFLKVVTALKHGHSLKDILGIWWKENGKIQSTLNDEFIDLNKLPPLPYHLIDCEKYIKLRRLHSLYGKNSFEVHTDRGCPHRCSFCYNINFNKSKWRSFSVSRITGEIEYLTKKFSLDGFTFVCDNFFVDKKRVADICIEIIKRKLKITWYASCRIDYFSRYEDSFIELLKKSGCRLLGFGVESGSPRILDLIHKDITVDEVLEVNKKLRRWQIPAGFNFMVGFPGETKEDALQTYRLMIKLHDENPYAMPWGPHTYAPYPGTPLYHKSLEMGFQPPEKLEDWGEFGSWKKEALLPFIEPVYAKWLLKSAAIARHITVGVKGLEWIGLWFKLRTKIIIKFNIIGPLLEERLINLARAIISFVWRILK